MELTASEKKIVEILREAKPFERLEITKDKDGRPDTYFIHRTQKVWIAASIVKRP